MKILPRSDFSKKDAAGGIKSKCRKCLAPVKAQRERFRYKYDEGYRQKKLARDKQRARHGLTPADKAAMIEAQGGLCAVCGATEPNQVDHDHRCCPGNQGCKMCVRAILCGPCNSMLGHAKDDPERLQAGIAYLARFP